MDPFTQFAVAFVLMIASAAISAMLIKKPENQKPATLSDFQVPQADEGTPEAVFFGDCWTGGWQVLWYGKLRTEPIRASGGK